MSKITSATAETPMLGLKTESNVYLTGYAVIMYETVSKYEEEVIPILDISFDSSNPILRNFCRNVYPRQKLIEKLNISIKSTENQQ